MSNFTPDDHCWPAANGRTDSVVPCESTNTPTTPAASRTFPESEDQHAQEYVSSSLIVSFWVTPQNSMEGLIHSCCLVVDAWLPISDMHQKLLTICQQVRSLQFSDATEEQYFSRLWKNYHIFQTLDQFAILADECRPTDINDREMLSECLRYLGKCSHWEFSLCCFVMSTTEKDVHAELLRQMTKYKLDPLLLLLLMVHLTLVVPKVLWRLCWRHHLNGRFTFIAAVMFSSFAWWKRSRVCLTSNALCLCWIVYIHLFAAVQSDYTC